MTPTKPLSTLINSLFAITVLTANVAYADIEIYFLEGAPKDEFVVKNTGVCPIKQFILDIDLSSSAGNLIFDTSDTGQGVQVFQPFEVSGGRFELISQSKGSEVKDGENMLSLKIAELKPNEQASFTIDVDDKLTNSQRGQTQVTGTEMEGALTRLNLGEAKSISAAFGKDNRSIIPVLFCE